MADTSFHAHLEICEQCRDQPLALCSTGAAALKREVEHGGTSRRAPVQSCEPRLKGRIGPGWIDWAEHLDVYELYAQGYGREQSAERIAERGGFGYCEIELLTGAAPKTWRAR